MCHKYIHIMGWKDQISKEIATCQNSVSPRICCEKAAAGMLRAFPVHFVPLQSRFIQPNVYGLRAGTENWMKMWLFIWNRFYGFCFETVSPRKYLLEYSKFYIYEEPAHLPYTGATRQSRFLHISHSLYHKMKIIPLENPWTWVTTLSTVKCVTNTLISWGEKTK